MWRRGEPPYVGSRLGHEPTTERVFRDENPSAEVLPQRRQMLHQTRYFRSKLGPTVGFDL